MKKIAGGFTALMGLAGSFVLLLTIGWAQTHESPLERYRKLEFPATEENFTKGWQERVALEYEIINTGDLKSLRSGLKDEDPFVRAIAARALGILSDRASADMLADLVKTDPEYLVRLRAVESLGYLKMKPEVIELAKKDSSGGVSWVANFAADQARNDTDYAKQLRKGFARGIKRKVMGSAKVGMRAPDFAAQTSDGKKFKLSHVLGKKPLAIYFAAFDG